MLEIIIRSGITSPGHPETWPHVVHQKLTSWQQLLLCHNYLKFTFPGTFILPMWSKIIQRFGIANARSTANLVTARRTCKGVGVTDFVTRSESSGRPILTENDENDAQKPQKSSNFDCNPSDHENLKILIFRDSQHSFRQKSLESHQIAMIIQSAIPERRECISTHQRCSKSS